MEAKELRIGNWVYNPVQNIDFQVSGGVIATEEGRAKVIKNYLGFIPVTLTEEWLVKLGFVKDKTGDEHYKDDFIIYLPYFFQYKDCVLKEIKYVHQLQNLYYALTQTELKHK